MQEAPMRKAVACKTLSISCENVPFTPLGWIREILASISLRLALLMEKVSKFADNIDTKMDFNADAAAVRRLRIWCPAGH